MQKTVNDQLVLRILDLIQTGSNSPSRLNELLEEEPDFHDTLRELMTAPNGILDVESSTGNFIIKGSESGAWPLNIHKFLDDNGYRSIIQSEDGA